MNPLFKTALEIQQFLEDRDWAFCFFGGLAVARWGQPRTTQDVDLTLLTGFGREKTYIDEMLAHFDGRLPDAGPFALDSRVLLLKACRWTSRWGASPSNAAPLPGRPGSPFSRAWTC